MPKRNLLYIMALFVAAIGVVFIAHNGQTPSNGPRGTSGSTAVDEAMQKIRENYRQDVDERKLMEGAVGGMVGQLDPYCTYIPPDKVEQFNSRMLGNSRGVGLRVEIVDGVVTVIGPLVGSPAHRAGLRGGDRIESLNDRPLAGLTLEQVYELLDRGKDSKVVLVVRRGTERRTVNLEQAALAVETVQGLYRDAGGQWVYTMHPGPGVAYVRVREFVRSTPEELHAVLMGLGSPRGVILDLRDNPGGLLESAVAVANLFIAKGRIVTAVDRGGTPQHLDARPERTYNDKVPLVVLVNGHTASAAEIVAGSLWVHDRAVLVGTRTLGKGCVQSMFSLGDLGQMNLTTAEYYLAGGLPITRQPGSDMWGVDPNLQVMLLHEEQVADLRTRAEVMPTPPPATTTAASETIEQQMLRLDTQLSQALDLVQDSAEMQALTKQAAAARAKRLPTTLPAE